MTSLPLRQLASLYGVQTSYQDIFGQRQTASAEALLATLEALGAPVDAVREAMSEVTAAIRARERQLALQTLEPVMVAWNGRLAKIPLRLAARHRSSHRRWRVRVMLHQEDGAIARRDFILSNVSAAAAVSVAGQHVFSVDLPLHWRLPMGYHRVELECGARRFEALVIAAPAQCYAPPGARRKLWGAFLPLYALRARHGWGTGDFTAMARLGEWVREIGGDLLGTLPFHAAFLDQPCEPSPYMPVSRLFWNELYVDPRQAAEFSECRQARRLAESPAWQREMRALQAAPLVDYRRAMRLKRPVLEALSEWMAENDSPRGEAFRKYVQARPALRDYARFRAVHERQRSPWSEWPQRMRDGRLLARDADPAAEQYHQYVQWLAEEQVSQLSGNTAGAAGNDTTGRGESSGLYLDFPLGVHPQGYDVWRYQDLFARKAAAGAPPDRLFRGGQNWAFPPLHPEAMRRDGYAYLRACLRQQMRHARLVRIDHVMGLHRLYWIPQGLETRAGVYVRYRAEEMYAILSIESHRARTWLAGENLGTVPQAVNRALERRGLRRLYVMQFGIKPQSLEALTPPEPMTVASLNTHDTPPFAGYLEARDVADFRKLGVFSEQEAAREEQGRRHAVAALARYLTGRPAPKTPEAASKLLRKCLEWLARSPAEVALINLEDCWLETAPQNIPGTQSAQSDIPNWRRKARLSLEKLIRSAEIRDILLRMSVLRNPDGKRSV